MGLTNLEALYGGAAGGGKSSCLLLDAVRWVDRPEYSAIVLRRTFAQLSLRGSILERAREWWHGKAKYREATHTFTFPSGATIAFGHLESEGDIYRYQGPEFHRVYFDELTQFSESQYTYLLSRLRRTTSSDIPIAARSATNPGGIGHVWVRKRFITPEAAEAIKSGEYGDCYSGPCDRAFVPSRLEDNAYLDREQYRESLAQIADPVTRAQLGTGDWTVAAESRFKPDWFAGRWRWNGEHYQLLTPAGQVRHVVDSRGLHRYACIDPAGTSQEVAAEAGGRRQHSYSVVSVFDYVRQPIECLVVRHVERGRWESPELLRRVGELHRTLSLDAIHCEGDGIGRVILQQLRTMQLPVKAIMTEGKDKLTRAIPACNEAAEGRIYLPEAAPWLADYEGELFTWTGNPNETSDQIDTLAYGVLVWRKQLSTAHRRDAAPMLLGSV